MHCNADENEDHILCVAGAAAVGDWIEAQVDVQKVGRSLAFANCYVVRDGQRIVHASAIFSVATVERST